MKNLVWMMFALILGISLFAADKKEVENHYKDKYVVPSKDGLLVGVCSTGMPWRFRPAKVTVSGDVVEFEKPGGMIHQKVMMDSGCGGFIPEPVQAGEVLRVTAARVEDQEFLLTVETVSPHSVTRGRGAGAFESHEIGKAEIHFRYPSKKALDEGLKIVARWVSVFNSLEEAAASGSGIGNTAAGAFVKEVKLGMSIAQVESVMGLPVSKADLGEKVLYKYKDMTIEFRDGKVVDVR